MQSSTVAHSSPVRPAHWIAAAIVIFYGFAKLNGAQFTILDSELTKPLGEVSGFWLTWYYFGYSPAYGNLIALVQVLGGVMLVVPRTATFGALILLPVVGNIILIDLFYQIDFGATIIAVILLTCLLIALSPQLGRIWRTVVPESAPRVSWPTIAALCLLVPAECAYTWWVANYNNRAPSKIDGVWIPEPPESSPWKYIFLERNRAHLVVFRPKDGPDSRHRFEVDQGGTVRIWQRRRTKGPLLYEGRLTSAGLLSFAPESGGNTLVLRKFAEPGMTPTMSPERE